jgi:two-component system, OmpR family, KDP operon response regulator KdpE
MSAQTHPATVLVIDDEVQIRRLLRRMLEEEGYRVVLVDSGKDGLVQAGTQRPDVIVLDLGLPDMDGLEVLVQLRSWSSVPVVILSVRESEETIVRALDGGADDYLTKPFRSGELLARVRALLRHRTSGQEDQLFTLGDLKVDLAARSVEVRGEAVRLTPTEYALLELFVRNAGKVLTHGFVLREVWGPTHAEETQYLRVFIGQLRKKIERDPSTPHILLTEPGVGYRLAFPGAAV